MMIQSMSLEHHNTFHLKNNALNGKQSFFVMTRIVSNQKFTKLYSKLATLVQFRYCFPYPSLIFLREDSEWCDLKCNNSEGAECCSLLCCFEKMGILVDGQLSPQGFISGFSASIDFESSWMSVIDTAVNRCYDTGKFFTHFQSIKL